MTFEDMLNNAKYDLIVTSHMQKAYLESLNKNDNELKTKAKEEMISIDAWLRSMKDSPT